MVARKQSGFGAATTCPLVWRLMLLVLAAAKQVGLRCSQGFARSTGDVRQPGRLVSGGYPGRRLVCSRASSIYWFKVSFLRGTNLPEGLGKLTWGLVGKCLGCMSNFWPALARKQPATWAFTPVEGSCCWFLRLQSRLVWDVPKALQGRQGMCGSLAGWFQVAIQAVDWFVPEHHLSIGLRCQKREVHRRHLMHGGTQTIRFWGLQHVHWCEGSCCWFLRLQSRLVWDVPKALQGRQGMCGSLAGWFQVAIQAVDWFVPEHHLSILV